MLEKINSSADLKQLNIDELQELANDVRKEIIETTVKNGGHLASNLGAVELTLALHYVFDTPTDKLVFDVGHQCYTHKLITGRRDGFKGLRKKDGINGFPTHTESEYDVFDAGHSSTAISAALGLARARDSKNESYKVIALVGDGAIGGGMAFEALNDLGNTKKTDLIIVLNDNEMSISKNVGAISGNFSKLRAAKGYILSKNRLKRFLDKINKTGKLTGFAAHIRNSIRYLFIGDNIFEAMNVTYLGPINGHSFKDLIDIFERAKECKGPVIIHTITQKGRGYEAAEENPERYHGVSPKKLESGDKKSFMSQVGTTLCELAEKDESVCAITAGMTYNTGLYDFSVKYADRFFDTGIAEQHAIAMAGGLAKGGMKPFVVIYSTFLQRGFDQIFHDVCLQNVNVTICIDHAGLTGEDGATHQGIYDMGFLRAMPNLTVLAPRDAEELDRMLKYAKEQLNPVAIRYPKGSAASYEGERPFNNADWDVLCRGNKGTFVTFGSCIETGLKVAKEKELTLVDARSIKPLDEKMLMEIKDKPIFVLEDNVLEGGLCEAILGFFAKNNIKASVKGFCLKDEFVLCGSVSQQLEESGLDAESILMGIENET